MPQKSKLSFNQVYARKVQAKSQMLSFTFFAFDLVKKNELVRYNFRSKNRNVKKRPLLKTSKIFKNVRILEISIYLCPRHAFCQNKPVLTNRVIEPWYDLQTENTKKKSYLKFRELSKNVNFSKKFANLRLKIFFYEKS